ncbi:MAG: TldD/PmbA family protein [Syntrophomonas sp.]|uniref:TldD/PmbA family protein n=1 Tax=Syntrophomonas sp. TaxID=2053627 RepID=UPI0026184D48|nr:TldD/PmbA family protein [Syntrophomonas sp.]MDD2510233.1 TldD/PmbA family protein [Syntrophomonas sp.]MDD3878791.1 TldD/PmbA family protein [Syntrophomonas sp.]MDD4626817.1 TldD/PmbA family protein [Syntrophomonas sp.]
MEDLLREAGERALKAAHKKGMQAEVFLSQQHSMNLELRDGQVETLKQAEEMGLGLRLLNAGRRAFVYTADLSEAAIQQAVNDAVDICRYTPADEWNSFPEGPYRYSSLELYDENIPASCLEEKIEMAQAAEEAARRSDKRVKLIEKSGYEEGEYTSLLMNSHGLYAVGKANYALLYLSLVAREDDESQSGFSMMIKRKIRGLEPEVVGQEAALRAVRGLKSRRIDSTSLPCIIEPYIMARFLGLIAHLLSAEAVQKGKSLLVGKLGERVASGVLSITDDATLAEGLGSFPFDGEGVPGRKTPAIKNGVLMTYLYDHYSACKAGVESTGHGQRASFRHLPAVGSSNFILEAGEESPEQMIAGVDKGLYITEIMGLHTANPVSGDFSLGAAGLLIEKGCLSYPVRGITIGGNLVDFLQSIDAVGNDLRFFGARAAPSVRLSSLSVAGK